MTNSPTDQQKNSLSNFAKNFLCPRLLHRNVNPLKEGFSKLHSDNVYPSFFDTKVVPFFFCSFFLFTFFLARRSKYQNVKPKNDKQYPLCVAHRSGEGVFTCRKWIWRRFSRRVERNQQYPCWRWRGLPGADCRLIGKSFQTDKFRSQWNAFSIDTPQRRPNQGYKQQHNNKKVSGIGRQFNRTTLHHHICFLWALRLRSIPACPRVPVFV